MCTHTLLTHTYTVHMSQYTHPLAIYYTYYTRCTPYKEAHRPSPSPGKRRVRLTSSVCFGTLYGLYIVLSSACPRLHERTIFTLKKHNRLRLHIIKNMVFSRAVCLQFSSHTHPSLRVRATFTHERCGDFSSPSSGRRHEISVCVCIM